MSLGHIIKFITSTQEVVLPLFFCLPAESHKTFWPGSR